VRVQMTEINSKSRLAIALSRLEGFSEPKVRQEQYLMDSEIGASVLWNACLLGDIRGKVIADLGCGTGMLGIGALMLGATMTGALAQNLADYPQPFIGSDGVFNDDTAIVVGLDALASDTIGMADIVAQLQFDAKTPVSGGDGTIIVAGGVTEDIPLGFPIADDNSTTLDKELSHTKIDISSFPSSLNSMSLLITYIGLFIVLSTVSISELSATIF